ncbi:MAG TPA: ABC transporter permease [Bdellovibrionales bacterium]|nr:ABC transporter permease [Bdellovibrionales bacterium]
MSVKSLHASLESMGRWVLNPIEYTLEVLLMIYLSIRAAFFDQAQGLRSIFTVVSAQIYFTGFQALPLISVLALASGSVVILQSSTNLSLLGGGAILGDLIVAIIVRELAPLLTALIVIARSGTAVASDIGNMRVNREIEALEAMGIHPLSYVVFPRLMGGVVSVVCLAVYFVLVACMGGYFVTSLLHDLPFSFYGDSLARAFSSADVGLFFLKNTFSGLIIFMICCYQGFLVKQSPHEVPQVTTKAVVNSVIYVVIFNMTVTILFYLGRLVAMGVVH